MEGYMLMWPHCKKWKLVSLTAAGDDVAALSSTSKKHLSKFDLRCFVRPWTMGISLNAHAGVHIYGSLKM